MAFDPNRWTDEEYRLVEGLIESYGWKQVMAPMMEMGINGASLLLDQHPDARPTPKWGDEYYKGYKAGLMFARFHWEQRLRERAGAQTQPAEPEGSGSPYASPPESSTAE